MASGFMSSTPTCRFATATSMQPSATTLSMAAGVTHTAVRARVPRALRSVEQAAAAHAGEVMAASALRGSPRSRRDAAGYPSVLVCEASGWGDRETHAGRRFSQLRPSLNHPHLDGIHEVKASHSDAGVDFSYPV